MLRSLKCQRRRKHIGKKTWSVTIVIFVRTARQDWTQSVITSENSYSSMIFQPGVQQTVFDSQQLLRTFWLSRTLPSDFFSTKRVDSRTVNRRPLRQMKAAFKLKKETRGYKGHDFLGISPLQANLAARLTHSREPARATNCNTMRSMGLRSLSRSINGQNPRSGRSSVSTRMLLLLRSNSHLLRLDLESHRSGAFVAQTGAPTIRYRDSDPWT